jgi:hypothetical protein
MRNLERTDVREETSGATGIQQRHKEPSPKRAITSGKQENTQQDVQADRRAGDHKANSLDFHQTAENQCQGIVERSASSEAKDKTAHRVGAEDAGALTTLGTFSLTDRYRRMIVIRLDRLAPYQGAARDEWSQGGSSWKVRSEPRGRKVRTITDVTSTALRKEEMAIRL